MEPVIPRLFVLGDSISIQYGPFLELMLAGNFLYSRKSGEEEALRNLDIPQGANGGDSGMCLGYLRGVLGAGQFKADLLLLNCGLHDVKRKPDDPHGPTQVSIDDYRGNLQAIVELLREHRLPMIWVRTTPVCESQHNVPGSGIIRYQKDVDRYNAVSDAIMSEEGIYSIDLAGFSLTQGTPAEILHDGRHFHEPIRKLQAAHIAGYLIAWRQSRFV